MRFIPMHLLVIMCLYSCLYANVQPQIDPPIVLVFGCFDLFHEGHQNFLLQACQFGKVLAVITPDHIIKVLKKRSSIESQETRLQHVINSGLVWHGILGDQKLGEYTIFKEFSPTLICLGYDQQGLFKDLQERMLNNQIPTIPMIFLKPYKEEEYHTSILRKQLPL